MIEIVRLMNPKALDVPEIEKLFTDALKGSLFAGGDFASAKEEFRSFITDPKAGVFVGIEGGSFKALGVILLPQGKLLPVPQVLHFYNSGSLALKHSLMREGVDFMKEKGYNTFWAFNANGIREDLWFRAFRGAGKVNKIGSMVTVNI